MTFTFFSYLLRSLFFKHIVAKASFLMVNMGHSKSLSYITRVSYSYIKFLNVPKIKGKKILYHL